MYSSGTGKLHAGWARSGVTDILPYRKELRHYFSSTRTVACYLATRQITCGFWIYYLDLPDIRQAELQLIVSISTVRNYNHDNTLNASVTTLRKLQASFLLVWNTLGNCIGTVYRSQTQSHIVADRQSVSQSVSLGLEPHLGLTL
jgi:hypothetical protein